MTAANILMLFTIFKNMKHFIDNKCFTIRWLFNKYYLLEGKFHAVARLFNFCASYLRALISFLSLIMWW